MLLYAGLPLEFLLRYFSQVHSQVIAYPISRGAYEGGIWNFMSVASQLPPSSKPSSEG